MRLANPLPPCHIAGRLEAGCDEAGRGCLAGPVFAAAVILPDDFSHPLLNDSKQMSEKRRMELREIIMSQAVAWAIASVDAAEIDEMNILNASIEAMHRALRQLNPKPGAVIVDGNRFKPYGDLECTTFVKGDLFMTRAALEYPQYGWDVNKGYPTPAHRAAIAQHGPSPLHRLTFRLLPEK